MRSLSIAAAAALLTAHPTFAQEVSGFVQTERGRVEISGGGAFFGSVRAMPATRTANAKAPSPRPSPPLRGGEGEMSGVDRRTATPTVNLTSTSTPTPTLTSTSTATDPCRAPRSAYLRQLLRTAGIELDDPLALLEGLAGARGYEAAALFTPYGLLPGIDPIRPLAWDSELRRLGRELTRCAAGER
jgi:hypothetical protein